MQQVEKERAVNKKKVRLENNLDMELVSSTFAYSLEFFIYSHVREFVLSIWNECYSDKHSLEDFDPE